MLVAELRYLASNVAAFALLAIPLIASLYIGKTAHLPFAITMLLFVAFLCALGWVAFALWSRNRGLFRSTMPARYVPLVFPIVVLGVEAYWIATSIPPLQPAYWEGSAASTFLTLCFSSVAFAFFTLKDWRTRYLQAEPAVIPAFRQERLEQLSSVMNLPDATERKRAMRPLVTRGCIRLGLLIGEIVLIFVLAPHIGIAGAVVGSFSLMAVAFLAGRKFFDL